MNNKKILIGYWNNDNNDYPEYPHPKDLIDPEYWKAIEKAYINKSYFVEYLDSGIPSTHYRGFSVCRICGIALGSSERCDDKYVWPYKLSHYIQEHDVMLPIEFIEYMYSKLSTKYDINYDFWKNYKF